MSRPSSLRAPQVSAPEAVSEAVLLGRLRAGDTRAFDELYLAHHPGLCAFVMSYLGVPAVAEDVVQDVLCRVWEIRATFEAPGGLRAYLYRAARNRALNYLRDARQAERWEMAAVSGEVPSGMSVPPVSADAAACADELSQAIARAIEALPPRCRQAYQLRWQHNMPYAQVAQVMGISVKAVEALMARAVQSIRTAIGPYL